MYVWMYIHIYMHWCVSMFACMFMYMYLWMHMHVCACRDLKLTSVSSWVNFHFSYRDKIFHWAQICLSGLDFMYALGILTPYSQGARALFADLSLQLSMYAYYLYSKNFWKPHSSISFAGCSKESQMRCFPLGASCLFYKTAIFCRLFQHL